MHLSIRSVARSLIAVIAFGVLMTTTAGAAAAVPGAKLWRHDYDGPASGDDWAWSVATSPDGSRVFATGYSFGGDTTGFDIATVAYDPATGDELWSRRYNSKDSRDDAAYSVVVSPDGTRIFVTGYTDGGYPSPFLDYLTIAYDAATGDKLWSRKYDGPASGRDDASWATVSPDGATVYVTGESTGTGTDFDFATVAYEASSGTKLWTNRYDGPGHLGDYAYAVAASQDGTTVVITGQSSGTVNPDMATVAYDAGSGVQVWAKRYKGPDNRFDDADALGISPDSAVVFVTGGSSSNTSGYDFATIAYDSVSGTKLWATRYDGPPGGDDAARALAVSPDGTRVFVGGVSISSSYADYATVAYDATNGTQVWSKRYAGPGGDYDAVHAIGTSPDGTKVYVTGESVGSGTGRDYATLSYDAATGTKLWASRYKGSGNGDDYARSIAVSPDGTQVFVTGEATGTSTAFDYVTISYAA